MRAIRLHRFGGPSVLKLESIPPPVPRRGQMLIEVVAGSVNPVDAKIRTGTFHLFKPRLPAILGRDIAGIVRTPAKGFKVGDAVFGMIDYERGGYADFTVATPRELARRPARVPARIAGVLGVAALTAWQGLFDHGHLKAGQRVLIHGAAGGVGHFAVQFAKLRGAAVIATAGKADLAWVRSLGADRVIDYQNEPFENEVGNLDLVFDLISGETQDRSWQTLKERGGRLVSTRMPPSKADARRHHASGILMAVKANSAQLAKIAGLIAAGQVRVTIGRQFPLAQIRRAHAAVESGHGRGKIALIF